MSILNQISERSFANISLGYMAKIIGIETTNKRKAVTKRSTYKRTFLTAADIKIYVLLHFLVHSGTGTAQYVITKQVADAINVNYKTVLASYKRLVSMGLLTVFKIDSDSSDIMTIHIVDYETMFVRRGEGGNGYFTMNMEYLQLVLDAKSINELRVLLRITAQTATDELYGATKEATSLLSYKELRRGLPAYVKPGVIRHAMSYVQSAFEHIDYIGKRIKLTLGQDYQGKHTKERIRNEAKNAINTLVKGVNSAVMTANMEIYNCRQTVLCSGYFALSSSALQRFADLGIQLPDWRYSLTETEAWAILNDKLDKTNATDDNDNNNNDNNVDIDTVFCESLKTVPKLTLSQSDIEDCMLLSQDYGVKAVMDTLRDYYTIYVAGDITLPDIGKGLGGLLRAMLRQDKVLKIA